MGKSRLVLGEMFAKLGMRGLTTQFRKTLRYTRQRHRRAIARKREVTGTRELGGATKR